MPTEYRNYVGGAFLDHEGEYADVLNPSTTEVYARVPQTDATEAAAAVAAARKARSAWEALPPI